MDITGRLQEDEKMGKSPPAVDSSDAPHVCSIRLRYMLTKLQTEDIAKEELMRNIEYTIRVLDTAYISETGTTTLADDEDELSKVETEAVPSEVRDWLALTFTRSSASSGTSKRRENDNKPKFRSVANAIRAGILVDRIYRRISSVAGLHIPPNIASLLKGVDNWSFDVFSLNAASDGHALKFVGYELLMRYDLINKFKINVQILDSFLLRLEQGYGKFSNPYHNLMHAADVAQTMHHLISKTALSVWMSDLEIYSTIIAALIHDYEHTGTTNTFHINTRSDVAMLYNDKAVLENHHLSAAFRLLKEDDYNILANLKLDEYRDFRSLVIEIVLATDMSFHFQQIKAMKSQLSAPESVDRTKALSMLVHCCDISHPSKDWEQHHRWTEMLIAEFFIQGDLEKELGLQVSPLCDRSNTLVAESQIGFIDFIVEPTMQVLGDMIDRITEIFQQIDGNSSSTAEESADSRTTSTSSCSAIADRTTNSPALPKSAKSLTDSSSGVFKFETKRPWDACLSVNRQMWKDRAAKGWISPLQELETTSSPTTTTVQATTRTTAVKSET